MSDGYLRFAHPNVGLVMDGLEDATVRYDFERDMEAGDRIRLLTPNGQSISMATVEEIYGSSVRAAFWQMVKDDRRNHPATGPSNLLGRLRQHYDDGPQSTISDVTVIYFDADIWGDVDD